MPNIASHIICSKYLIDNLKIENPLDFYRGSIYPDLIYRGHYGKIYKKYYIPNIKKFIKKYKNNNKDFYLGYLSHLLLDNYYVTNFVDKQIPYKAVINRGLYKDYNRINCRLLKDYDFDYSLINIIKNYNDIKVNKRLLNKNIKYLLNEESSVEPKYINYNNYKEFLNKTFTEILKDLKDSTI